MSATERPAPPAETTDGTLTFKMPQATTAPSEPGEEEGRGALKILDDYFGGATFDSAIFGTDDGGPIDEAREKLQKSWDCLRSLILAPATAAVGVTREWVQKEILDALRICGREDIDIVCHALREKGIIVEEGEETMTNFDATISLLRELLKDELEILKPSDHSQLESAIHILEAARGVDKEVAWGELADSDIVHGLDGGLYDLLAALPDKEKP